MEFGQKFFFVKKLIYLISRVFFWPGLFQIFWPIVHHGDEDDHVASMKPQPHLKPH